MSDLINSLLDILKQFFDWCWQGILQLGKDAVDAAFKAMSDGMGHIDPGMADASTGMTFFNTLSDWFPVAQIAVLTGILLAMGTVFLAVKGIDWVMDIIP